MDPFVILGLPPDADAVALRAAYRHLARIHHPDHGGSATRMREINLAYRAAGELLRGRDRECPYTAGARSGDRARVPVPPVRGGDLARLASTGPGQWTLVVTAIVVVHLVAVTSGASITGLEGLAVVLGCRLVALAVAPSPFLPARHLQSMGHVLVGAIRTSSRSPRDR